MFVALDAQGNRVYADEVIDKHQEYRCQACYEALQCRIDGKIRKPYFAHKPKSECVFKFDKDNKSPWHIRMQEYFPKEAREVRFVDEETGEIHIADVFIEETDTVLEFQHSPIKEEEFLRRTSFYLNNGKRIAWLFDEETRNPESKSYGRFKEDDMGWERGDYYSKSFKWLRMPRSFLKKGPDIKELYDSYSVCVYTGTEGDVFHRIVGEHWDYEYITLSLSNVEMKENMNVDDFFGYDLYWQHQDFHKMISKIEEQKFLLSLMQNKNQVSMPKYSSRKPRL